MKPHLGIITAIVALSLVSFVLLAGSLTVLVHNQNQMDAFIKVNCGYIEDLKAGQRESAQATITGDKLLLKDHDLNGTPLPVPRQAIIDDIAAKQIVVDRFPAKDC